MQFIELGPFKGQIIHQAFLAKYKRYDRVLNIGGIQRVPHTQRDQCQGFFMKLNSFTALLCFFQHSVNQVDQWIV